MESLAHEVEASPQTSGRLAANVAFAIPATAALRCSLDTNLWRTHLSSRSVASASDPAILFKPALVPSP